MSPRANRRDAVLDAGLAMASARGLANLTIGQLAEAADLTKAGLYAHFDSKADLLLGILERAVNRFILEGVGPALREPAGEARVRALIEAWLEWTQAPPLPGGCVFISSAVELDDRPGPLRDYLVSTQRRWVTALTKAIDGARREGDFRDDLDTEQFVFELYGIVLAFHYYHRLFRDPAAETRARQGIEELLARARVREGASS